ncbi:polygalacturonase 1 beta-like protein 1 [Syzygium oleosum]|uniref:polygalacturonase 1 beta-like protein 1 n=1 Tax=Syzygium oleosum TaxID=219896 RepID=UPI0024BA35CA|nr:polygalacturonase 1 beta-like protein 1 [Syzygium oleosum]
MRVLIDSVDLLCFLLLLSVGLAGAGAGDGDSPGNPFTPRASLLRYWNKEIPNAALPKPAFLLSKASPLDAVDAAAFAKLAARGSLADHLPAFCAAAGLLCFPDLSPSLEKHPTDSDFAVYSNKNFSNYGNDRLGGLDSFKNYSDGENVPIDTFRRYSHDSSGHGDRFANYGPGGNVVDQSFSSYGGGATGGTGEFKNYNPEVNVPNLNFNNYGSDANGRAQTFTAYTDETNAGAESFSSYGKNGNGAPNKFAEYASDSNVITSDFNGYGQGGNGANDTFANYGKDGNVPENNFKNYGDGGNGISDGFANYRDQSNVGDDSFQSYAKNSNSAKVHFANYGKSFNEGTDKFSGYGQAAKGQEVEFKTYGVNNTFKDYGKTGVRFAQYANATGVAAAAAAAMVSGRAVNRWVEPGKFFRESMLKKGTVMPMPDITDKMPKRSFLPRSILSKLPFSTSKLAELKRIFHAGDNSSMEAMMANALAECERAPSAGETKRCVGSIEDMIDFATSVLGHNVVARSTESTAGSKHDVMVGAVHGINGGKVTKSVSCHQSLFPYLLYYCHSVPKVRVYEADLLDPRTKAKVNHGVAICHVDTSAWSATHGAFLALGSRPGMIEVCHWIFENDLTWATAD